MDFRIILFLFKRYHWWVLLFLMPMLSFFAQLAFACVFITGCLSLFTFVFFFEDPSVLALPVSKATIARTCWFMCAGLPLASILIFWLISRPGLSSNLLYNFTFIYLIALNFYLIVQGFFETEIGLYISPITFGLFYFLYPFKNYNYHLWLIAVTLSLISLLFSKRIYDFFIAKTQTRTASKKRGIPAENFSYQSIFPKLRWRPEYNFIPYYAVIYLYIYLFPFPADTYLNLAVLILVFAMYFLSYIMANRVYAYLPVSRKKEFIKISLLILLFSFLSSILFFYNLHTGLNIKLFIFVLLLALFIKTFYFVLVLNYPTSTAGVFSGIFIGISSANFPIPISSLSNYIIYILLGMNLLSFCCFYQTFLFGSAPYTYKIPMHCKRN